MLRDYVQRKKKQPHYTRPSKTVSYFYVALFRRRKLSFLWLLYACWNGHQFIFPSLTSSSRGQQQIHKAVLRLQGRAQHWRNPSSPIKNQQNETFVKECDHVSSNAIGKGGWKLNYRNRWTVSAIITRLTDIALQYVHISRLWSVAGSIYGNYMFS